MQPWWLHVPDEIRLEHGQAPTNLLQPCNQLVRPTPPVGDQHSSCCSELDEVTFMSSVNPLFGDIPGSTTRPTVIENNDAEFAGTNFLLGTDTNISAPNMDCLSIFDQLFDMPTAGTLQDQSHSLNHDPALSPEEESTRSFAASPAPKTGSTTAPRSLTRPFICEFRKKDGTICGHSCEKRCFLRYVRHFPVCSHRLSFAEDYILITYRKHQKWHEKRFTCNDCGRQFSAQKDLTRHENGTHKNIRPYSCPRCDRSYPRKDNFLNRHMKTCKGRPQRR